MERMRASLARLIRDERGATAIEYGLIAGLIGLAIVVGAAAVGDEVKRYFTMADSGLKI